VEIVGAVEAIVPRDVERVRPGAGVATLWIARRGRIQWRLLIHAHPLARRHLR
jgi:hypothetical protein